MEDLQIEFSVVNPNDDATHVHTYYNDTKHEIAPTWLMGKSFFSALVFERLSFYVVIPRKRSFGQDNIFTPVCHSVHGGGGCYPNMHCRCYPSMPCRGCTIPACIAGGIPLYLAWGSALGGGLVETPPPDGYCCGQYASYWNAFLFRYNFTTSFKYPNIVKTMCNFMLINFGKGIFSVVSVR